MAVHVVRLDKERSPPAAGLMNMISGNEPNAIKMLYVTPEKIAQSSAFKRQLDELFSNGLLARCACAHACLRTRARVCACISAGKFLTPKTCQ